MESLKDLITSPLSSRKLESIGQFSYMFGKYCIAGGFIGVVLFLFACLLAPFFDSSPVEVLTFGVDSDYWVLYILMGLVYLLIAFGSLGFSLYFFGLFVYGIGRIANNTEPKRIVEVIEKRQSEANAKKEWVCICGKKNPIEQYRCSCGKSEYEARQVKKAQKDASIISEYTNVKCPKCTESINFPNNYIKIALKESGYVACPHCSHSFKLK